METDWQLCDDIIKSNEMMLQHQHACDVFFTLGKESVRQGAHKFILVSRSPVFDTMFCGPLSDTRTEPLPDIAIPDIEPQFFYSFLQYLYCGHTEITAENVMNLLYCAKKYSMIGLAKKCVSYVEDLLDPRNACALLEQAHFFDEKEFQKKVLAVVLRKAEEILDTDDITQLCDTCLSDVVGSDKLMTSEDLVLKGCLRWAQAECERRGLAVSDSNCRVMLGNTLYKIRFPLLAPKAFVNQVAQGNLLSEEEKVDVMGRYIVPTRASAFFPTSVRVKQRQYKINRFQERNEAAFNNRSGSNAITFEVNKDIHIEGFTIYGACRALDLELQVKGHILDPDEKVLCSVETSVVTSGKQDVYDILFDEPANVHWGTQYTLVVNIMGSHTFAGQKGRLTAFCNDTVFTFYHSEKSETGTTVNHGQLPGLIFSR